MSFILASLVYYSNQNQSSSAGILLTGWVFAKINEWKSVISVRKWSLSNKTSVINVLL